MCDTVRDLNEQKTRRETLALHALAAIIPIFTLGAMFAINGVYPFGGRQILTLDFYHQYYPFISDLWYKLREGRSLVWSWTAGGGHDYLAHFAYYLASPLNFIAVLFPHYALREVLTAALLIKIGAAGLSMSIFLRYSLKKYDMLLPAFSSLYALCAFTLGYYWNIMWFDTFALFPIVILGANELLLCGKYRLYVISLTAAILFNFLIGLFVCIFVAITFAVHCIVNKLKMREMLHKLGKIAAYSAIAIGMTAFLMIPTFSALQSARGSASTFPDTLELHNSFAAVLGNFIAFTPPTGSAGLPNLGSGMICVMLLPVFLISKKTRLREKTAYMAVIGFLILSVNVNVLDYIWHGLNYTNMIPHRFSFIVSFIVVYIAYSAYLQIKEEVLEKRHIIAMGISAAFFLAMAAIGPQEAVHIILAAVLCAIYILLLSVSMINKIPLQRGIKIMFFLLIMAELVNTSFVGMQAAEFTYWDVYPYLYEETRQLLSERQGSDTDFHRTEYDIWVPNESSLYGYNGISYFSSTINAGFAEFMFGIGMGERLEYNSITFEETSPLTNSFLNLRYMYQRSRHSGDMSMSENAYFDLVSSTNGLALFENNRYLPLGFMVSEGVAGYVSDKRNPFNSQNNLFYLATGLEDDLFTMIDPLGEDHQNYEVRNLAPGEYSYAITEGQSSGRFTWNFEMPAGGSLYVFCRIENSDGVLDAIRLVISSEDVILRDDNIARQRILPVGNVNEGQKISSVIYPGVKSGTVQIYAGIINQEVFDTGFALLADETLRLTEFSDTKIAGDISVMEDGLLYTSIPHANLWKAYVNGRETEIITIDGAMAAIRLEAGEHSIEFRYFNRSLTVGLLISAASLLVFLTVILLDRKRTAATSTHPAPHQERQ